MVSLIVNRESSFTIHYSPFTIHDSRQHVGGVEGHHHRDLVKDVGHVSGITAPDELAVRRIVYHQRRSVLAEIDKVEALEIRQVLPRKLIPVHWLLKCLTAQIVQTKTWF